MTNKVAVIGATGAVGRRMLNELAVLDPNLEVTAFASARSAGENVVSGNKKFIVQEYGLKKLTGIPYVLMSAGGTFSKENAEAIAEQGAVVIDNSSAWRMDKNVPLVVPEVNIDRISSFKQGIIANPNCSTIQLVVSLKPLAEAFGLKRVHVSTYQSVSGSGQKGIEELRSQLEAFGGDMSAKVKLYPKQIAVNLLPAIDVMIEGGHCKEEEKMVRETKKIMGHESIEVLATTVRVPTLNCHCEAVYVELGQSVSLKAVKDVFKKAPGMTLYAEDAYEKFPYPLDISGQRDVAVGRVRLAYGQTNSSWVQYWNVADNLNKGAATNAVQILEYLLKRGGR